MQVAGNCMYRRFRTGKCDGNVRVPDRLKTLLDDLMYDTKRKSDLEFMFCQSEACVLGKKNDGREHVSALAAVQD